MNSRTPARVIRWFSFGATLTPAYNATGAYNPSNPMNPEFHSSFGIMSPGVINENEKF
jgi:hypothetical protein